MGGRTHPIHHDGYIIGLLGPPIESSQVVLHRLGDLFKETGGLRLDLGDSYWSLADLLLRSAFGGSPAPYPRLASGAGKSRDVIGRLEGMLSLTGGGGVTCTAEGSIISYSDLLHGYVQDARRVRRRLESVIWGFFWRGS